MERFPEKTEISLNSFLECGWLESITSSKRKDYSSMWQALSKSARLAVENSEFEKGKALWLLADACSMMLKPSSLNEPFRPYSIMDDKRSALPEDFHSEVIAIFSQFVHEITDVRLSARISDLVWLLLKPRDPKYALLAIDQYKQLPITKSHWVSDGRDCWDRAIQLCLMLKSGSGDRLKQIETMLIGSINESSHKDGLLALWISDILSKHSLGKKEKISISEKLKKIATAYDNDGDLHVSRDYFSASAEIFRKLGDEIKYTEMSIKVAEGWVKEAIVRQNSESPSNMVAASFYENAIQQYRKIPKSQRNNYEIDDRILRLREDLNEAGELSLGEMGVVRSPPFDISEQIENSRNFVKEKNPTDALYSLANIYPGPRVSYLREISEKMIQENPLQSLFSATYMSSDGRVIGKKPSLDLHGDENNEGVIWVEMVRHFSMEIGIIVQGEIWPALEVVRQEHRLRVEDYISITRQSPIVPQGREYILAKALFSGYDNDFVTALHVFVPQLEHLVRFHLKQRGVQTSNLDKNGIENENGLSTLVELAEFEQIFGEDLSFEIKALFCSPFGPNIRNELAHGLLDYEGSQSAYSIYAWWVGLRIIFNTYWNSKKTK